MKVYVASSITNKENVQEKFKILKSRGHEVTTDWTLTDDIPESQRTGSRDYISSLAKRDCEGVRDCDAFILLSEPAEGRSMYVELGLAIALYEETGKPLVFVIGAENKESIFYFHPIVTRLNSLDEVIEQLDMDNENSRTVSHSQEGRLEEFRALRNEMLEIIKGRIWGQATYAVLAAGLFASMSTGYKATILCFIISLAIPFLFHTIQREHARMRMGNYIRAVLEPRIPGMYWEEYLGLWRGRFGKAERKGWLNSVDRAKHIFGLSGLYILTSLFCWFLLFNITQDLVQRMIGSGALIALILTYKLFFNLYDKGGEEYEEVLRLAPKG